MSQVSHGEHLPVSDDLRDGPGGEQHGKSDGRLGLDESGENGPDQKDPRGDLEGCDEDVGSDETQHGVENFQGGQCLEYLQGHLDGRVEFRRRLGVSKGASDGDVRPAQRLGHVVQDQIRRRHLFPSRVSFCLISGMGTSLNRK